MPIAVFPEYQGVCKVCGRHMGNLSDLQALIDKTQEWMSGGREPEWPTLDREQLDDLTVTYCEIYGALYETLQFAETVLFNCDRSMNVAARANARMMLDRFMAVQHIVESGLSSWERYQYERGIKHLENYPHHFADYVVQKLVTRLERLAEQGTETSSYKPKNQEWHPLYADLSRFGVHFELGAEGDRRNAHCGQLVGAAHFCVCGIRRYLEPVSEAYNADSC